MLTDMGMTTDFIRIRDGLSRINLKVKNIDGTEINGMGPDILPEYVEELMKKLDALKEGDTLVLAGSIPNSISDDIYELILHKLNNRGIITIVDATSSLLMNVLKYTPFLIKPNQHELGEIFGVTLKERHEVVPYAMKLRELGARNVLVSMGGKGAVLISENGKVYEADAPQGVLKNSVGAGDSMVAGFLYGYLKFNDYEQAFRFGVGAGSASAFSDYLAAKDEVYKVAENIVIKNI